MSGTSGTGERDLITPSDVEAEFNFIQNLSSRLGVEDNLVAAVLTNQVRLAEFERRQAQALDLLTDEEEGFQVAVTPPNVEVIVEEVSPSLDLASEDLTIEPLALDQPTLEAGIRGAAGAVNRRQLYDTSSDGPNDDLLSSAIRPESNASSFRVSISLDTQTTFSLVVNPDEAAQFTETLNQGGDIGVSNKREFQFDVDPNAQYNFRLGAAGTVSNLRVQEVLVE